MNELLLLWLSLSLSGTLVTFALILFRPLLRKFGKTWQYYIWLLVILRLLIPYSPNRSIVGNLFQQAEQHFVPQYNLIQTDPEKGIQETISSSSDLYPETYEVAQIQTNSAPVIFLKENGLGILWLAVAVVLLFRKIYGYWQLYNAVAKESKRIEDGPLPEVLQTVCATMKIQKKIIVCINPLIHAPMLLGIIRPKIVLPSRAIPVLELTYIFRHELTHYRRMDFLYKWLTEIAVCLHWFNPLVYWVRKQLNQDCEFSCDEFVVSGFNDAERRLYGETLLHSITPGWFSKNDSVSLSLSGDGKLIRERLCGIMQYRRKPKYILFFATVLTSVLLCGAVFTGTYTMAATEKKKEIENIAPGIRIHGITLAPEGKISLGPKQLGSNTQCQIYFTWSGKNKLTVVWTSSNGTKDSYSVENGKAITVPIDTEGEYTFAVKNTSTGTVRNISGSIIFEQSKSDQEPEITKPAFNKNETDVPTVTYENVELRRYKGENGHPYIHDIKTNNTDQKIIGYQQGMLAFDKNGNPLKINWWSLDSDFEPTFLNLHESSLEDIASGETENVFGGWSLNLFGNDTAVEDIAYILYLDKEITFEDGTVWKNPEFDQWRSDYEGKKVDTSILEAYYPYEQKIMFNN